jgi:hypothetical protein
MQSYQSLDHTAIATRKDTFPKPYVPTSALAEWSLLINLVEDSLHHGRLKRHVQLFGQLSKPRVMLRHVNPKLPNPECSRDPAAM